MKNDCPYNAGITCPPNKRRCATCGWAPEEAKRRAEEEAKLPVYEPTKTPKQGLNRPRRVGKVNRHGRVVQVYSSLRIAAAENGISRDAIRRRCEGTLTRFDLDLVGYTFKYID